MAELGALIREGAANGGVTTPAEHASEVAALASLVGQARPDDVIAMMTHQDRDEVSAWLADHGGRRDSPEDLRGKVAHAAAS